MIGGEEDSAVRAEAPGSRKAVLHGIAEGTTPPLLSTLIEGHPDLAQP